MSLERYNLEETFPDPGFRNVSDDQQSNIKEWLRPSGDMHIPAIKTFQYDNLNTALLEKSKVEEDLYRKLHH